MSLPDFTALNKDGLPDDVHQELIPQLKQSIHTAWALGSGPCDGCPNRLMKKTCQPQFGAGSPTADLMFVAHTPGANDQYSNGPNRKVNPEKIEGAPDVEIHPLQAGYGYSVKGELSNWTNAFSVFRNRFFDDNRGLAALTEGRIRGFEDTYFTNAKKCSDIAGQNENQTERARNQCKTYLELEMEYVSPDIVVTWGKNSARSVAEILNYDVEEIERTQSMSLLTGDSGTTEDLLIGYRDTSPRMITMPHYSGLRGNNLNSIPGIDEIESAHGRIIEVYYQLAARVNRLLEDG